MHAYWKSPCWLQGRCSKDPNQRSVTVTITDVCPECESDHIDMQALTFNKVQAGSPAACHAREADSKCCTDFLPRRHFSSKSWPVCAVEFIATHLHGL